MRYYKTDDRVVVTSYDGDTRHPLVNKVGIVVRDQIFGSELVKVFVCDRQYGLWMKEIKPIPPKVTIRDKKLR